ncbi:MAG: MAPEG family protein [Gammaproteobacteria bacterium]|nr:MAPEG family protein [Gammaproteobacteria bacterium]
MLYPMFAMVLLTFIVGFVTIKVRFASVKNGEINPKYYRTMTGDNVPENVLKTSRCFANQFEIPVLFYVVCTLYIQMGVESVAAQVAAWGFIVARCLQAYVHLTYNNVLHRAGAFWLSCICVLVLWIILMLQNITA